MLGWWGAAAIIVLALLVTLGVTMRYVFNSPLYFMEDLCALLLMSVFFLAMPYTLITGGHVRIDALPRILPPQIAAWVEVGAGVLTSLFLILFTKLTTDYFLTGCKLGCHTDSAGLYEVPWLAVMVVGPALFAGVVLLSAIGEARRLIRGRSK